MAALFEVPIFMRVGDNAEHHIGSLQVDVTVDGQAPPISRGDLATMLREVADEVERNDPPDISGGI